MKRSIKSLISKRDIIIATLAFLALLAFFYFIFFTANYYEGAGPLKFTVNRGAALNEVIDSLYEKKIIPDKLNMKISAFIYGADKKIKAGRYEIPNGLSYLELVELLVKGSPEEAILTTFNEGITLQAMGRIVKNKLGLDSAAFVNISNDREFIRELGLNIPSLEGYLLPDSYYFFKDVKEKNIIVKLYKSMDAFWKDTLRQRALELGYTVHEILTLASIIQGECRKTSEMPKVAGVYYNRLNIGMKLEADPTIQFIVGGVKRVLYRHLEIDSPYNTYMYYGLPPGPINSPGKEAILAALYPEDHDYYYFVADGTGGHIFSKNFSEHNKAAAKYREWLQRQQ